MKHSHVLHYSRFIKLEHTLFSVPLLLSGAVLAKGGWPSWKLIASVIAAGFGGRTVAFALNRIIDRHIDALNPRTATRELPQGRISLTEAWSIGFAGLAIYLASAGSIAPFCFYWSPLPLVIFAAYPYLKRFTPLAHLGVGLADAMAPLGGWVAVTKSIHPFWPGFWLAAFTFFWVAGFDVIYATMDEEFDRKHGLHSLPSRFGTLRSLQISAALHATAFASLTVLYWTALHSTLALIALLVIGGLLYWENQSAANVELAFFKINAALGFGVLGLIAAGVRGGL